MSAVAKAYCLMAKNQGESREEAVSDTIRPELLRAGLSENLIKEVNAELNAAADEVWGAALVAASNCKTIWYPKNPSPLRGKE